MWKRTTATWRRALAIKTKLVREQLANPVYRYSLALTHLALGDLRARTGRVVEARTLLRDGLAVADALAGESPRNPDYQEIAGALATDLGRLAILDSDRREGLRLLRSALERLERLTEPSPESWCLKARARAQLGKALAAASVGSTASGDDRPSTHFETATAMLQRALAAGYRDRPWVATDPAIDPLRTRPDFRLLMMDMAMPTEVFASKR
jgi:hypothetical protein